MNRPQPRNRYEFDAADLVRVLDAERAPFVCPVRLWGEHPCLATRPHTRHFYDIRKASIARRAARSDREHSAARVSGDEHPASERSPIAAHEQRAPAGAVAPCDNQLAPHSATKGPIQ